MPDDEFKPVYHHEVLAGISTPPARMWITDLDEVKSLQVQFNPEEFEEVLKVEWAKMAPPGLPHRPMHYVGTDNPTFTFTLVFDAFQEDSSVGRILAARRFLRSLCYARKGATNVREGQAPRCLFIWPNFLRLQCVITDLKFKYERFAREGAPTRFSVQVTIENVRDLRLYLEDVRDNDFGASGEGEPGKEFG